MNLSKFIEFPRKTLVLTGSWPQQHSSWPYLSRRIIVMTSIALLLLALVYNASFHFDDPIKLSESLFILISVVNVFLKLIIMVVNEKVFLNLIARLETSTFIKGGILYQPIYVKFMEIVRPVYVTYFILVCGCVTFRSSFPAFDNKKFPLDFPHFHDGYPHYVFYFFQVFSLSSVAYDNMAIDLLVVGVVSIAAVQLQVLNSKLRDTKQNVQFLPNYSISNHETLTVGYLKDCCIHYSDIEDQFNHLKPLSIEAISLYFYLITMFTELGMYCWFGNFVYVESLEVINSCYLSHWEERGPAVRKTLFMLMERAKRPLEIKAVRFFTLSFDTFIVILKWSYSYFALLRNWMAD
ncbi:hypothetical protein HUJ05_013011 [Dendroctonus ponderosae]|nr:hypothetical protein HUJ05_013011 [Dendroctonus ponderosae]